MPSAEDGTLTIAQRHAFVREQYSILHSMSISLSSLAGDVPSGEGEEEETDLFQFLLDGVEHIAKLLDAHAKSLGVDEATLKAWCPVLSKSEAYHTYWSFLALSNKRAAAAAACAVNFPAWGQVCGRLLTAFASEGFGYNGMDDNGLAFLNFHATPINGLDEMAAYIIEKEGTSYEDLVEHVRLLQEFEVMFWDVVFEQGQSK